MWPPQKILNQSWFLTCVGIVLVAALLRFWQLGSVPHGMTWDEAAIGYNGYAVISARRDEWLSRLPISFRSFGDYKAPLAIYVNGIFTVIFGMELWVVRLPFVLASLVAMIAMMWLVWEVTLDRTEKWWFGSWSTQQVMTVVAGVLMAFSPWHFMYSRVGFESGMALSFVVVAMASAWKAARSLELDQQPDPRLWWSTLFTKPEVLTNLWLALAVISTMSAIYTYHSAKIVMPLLLVSGVYWWRKTLSKTWPKLGVAVIMLAVLGLPLVWDSVRGFGNERWQQASLVSRGYSTPQLVQVMSTQLVLHLSPAYLVGGWTDSLRHGDGRHGVLSPIEGLGVLWGVLCLLFLLQKFTPSTQQKPYKQLLPGLLLGLWWVLVGTLPAALGVDIPHSNRGLLALPGYLILAVWGWQAAGIWLQEAKSLQSIRGTHQEPAILVKAMVGMAGIILIGWFMRFNWYYYNVYAARSADDFKDGYLEAFEYVIPYEKGLPGYFKPEKIIFSNGYGQAYIYALFARRTNPIWYRGGSLNTYMFVDQVSESDSWRPNTIVVATAADPTPLEKADHVVYGSDGSVRFKIYVNEAQTE